MRPMDRFLQHDPGFLHGGLIVLADLENLMKIRTNRCEME